jgi:hypothetical protein
MTNDDEQHDPESALERMEDLGRRLFRVTKDELAEVEREAEEIVRDALGPPPEGGEAVAED